MSPDTLTEALAVHLFHRQARDYGADTPTARSTWDADEGLRMFWLGEAQSVVTFMAAWRVGT